MSINWVMLLPSSTPPFTPLPNEQTLFTSPPRIALAITNPAHYPGKQQQKFSVGSSSGVLYLTNRRVIYIPDKAAPDLQSFSGPILNLHDSDVTAPFFGPNVWQALLQPVQGGGIPTPAGGVVELKFTFKDGGAFDFHSTYERVRERLQQAVQVSREAGGTSAPSGAALNGVDVSNVNLDELPAYKETSDGPLIAPIAPQIVAPTQPTAPPAVSQQSSTPAFSPPSEPPPGYEEAQRSGLNEAAEWSEVADERKA
ncbi:hypothetical protein B0A48_05480 [Cryoendolithus antarcticus]|uniref:GRAM domain-containing protein n=1 Tax=Cryoendolithus antarcticus TaxID=1507870 RepID=A0A1V8TIV8_9PEZI|nr:hypothetical protein B0A48_05480 [Cryoendolithus antarcticus]